MISVGIDIGSYSIKVAEVVASGKSYVLKRFQVFPLSIDPNKDIEIEILDTLRNLSQQYDPALTKFVFGIDQKNVIFRPKTFPFKERHKILKILPFELEDKIPFSQDDAVFDAKITKFVGNSSEVLALACPFDTIEESLQLAEDCLIDLEILSIEGLALSNHFEDWMEPPRSIEERPDSDESGDGASSDSLIAETAEVFLEVGHNSTCLLVFSNKVLVEVRTFDWGGRYVAEALAKKYSIQMTEAVRELEAKSFLLLNNEGATGDQIEFSNCVKENIDQFGKNLQLTLLEIKSIHNLNFTKGLVSGGFSQLKNIGPFLTQITEIPFKRINFLAGNPANKSGTDVESHGLTSGKSIGLAIEGLKKPKNPAINLRKGDFAKQSQTLKLFTKKWGHALTVAAVAFFFFIIYGNMREIFVLDMVDKADTSFRQIATDIVPEIEKPVRASKSKVNRYIKNQEQIKRNIKIYEQLQSQNSALDILKSVSNAFPGSDLLPVNVKVFKVNNRKAYIEGEVKNKADADTLFNAVKGIAKGPVSRPKAKLKAQSGWFSFAFGFNVDRKSGGGR